MLVAIRQQKDQSQVAFYSLNPSKTIDPVGPFRLAAYAWLYYNTS
jgi:hypothetical protein